jgi:hypothetical protein
MAGSYTLPQTRVFQEFAQTPNDVTQNLNPFIIGPSYELMRYAKEDERGLCTSTKKLEPNERYTGAQLTLPWATPSADGVVDKAWYGVTFADVYVKLGTANSTCLDVADGRGTKFEFALEGDKRLAGTSDPGKLAFGVPVKAGDYLAYTDGSTQKFTKIRAVSMGTARSGEVVPMLKKRGAVSHDFTIDITTYTGEQSGTLTLTVNEDASKVSIVSTIVGIISGEKTLTTGTALTDVGLGLSITPTASVAAKGVYVLTLTVTEPYVRDTVTTSDIVPATASFTVVRHFDSIVASVESLAPSATGVTVLAGAKVDIGAHNGDHDVYSAEAYLDQRNLRTDHIDRVYSVRTDSDIATELGAFDTPDNPLAYAAHIMLLNNANTAIKFIGLKSDDMAGYVEALKRASITTEVYAFCPLTEDKAIIDAVVADCNRLSAPEEKSWRISFFSMPTPETADVTPEEVAMCSISADGLLTYSGSGNFTETVRADDDVTIVSTGLTYKGAAVKSNTTLQLNATFPNAITDARFRITHTRPRGEYVEAIAETSANFRDRRAYNVFPNTLRASDGNLVSGMYGAAAVCALACSVAPQQPITNVEIKGFIDLPDVYSKFSRDELNEIAAGGTLILMQEKQGGTVYVRHQISTAYRDGNLNTTELSLTKNLDSISYYFANRTSPYIGKYNLTDDLLAEVRGVIEDGLTFLETTTETNKLIGPQVLAEGTEIRSLYRTAEKDKAYCDVALNLPAPFNNFDLHLQVI